MYRVAIVDPQASTRAMLRDLLLRMNSVDLEAVCEDYDLFAQVISQRCPDVAIVAVDMGSPLALLLIAELAVLFPGMRILAVMAWADATLLIKVLRRGASGYLSQPITPAKLQAALAGHQEKRAPPPAAAPRRSASPVPIACQPLTIGCAKVR